MKFIKPNLPNLIPNLIYLQNSIIFLQLNISLNKNNVNKLVEISLLTNKCFSKLFKEQLIYNKKKLKKTYFVRKVFFETYLKISRRS